MIASRGSYARPPAATRAGERSLRSGSVLPNRAARPRVHRRGARDARASRDRRRSALQPIGRSLSARHASGARRHRLHARARDRRSAGARGARAARQPRFVHPRRRPLGGGVSRRRSSPRSVDAICVDDGEIVVPALADALDRRRRPSEVPGLLLRGRDGEFAGRASASARSRSTTCRCRCAGTSTRGGASTRACCSGRSG